MKLKKSVLIVEDDKNVRKILASFVDSLNNIISLQAENGIEAIETLLENNIDLILSDINMPEMNGLEFAGFIRSIKEYQSIPVIVFTSENNDDYIVKYKDLGIKDYVLKPFNPDTLKKVLRKYLKI